MKRQSKINQDVQWVKNQIVKVPRSTFYMKQDWQGTFNAGELVPFYCVDVLPGDTHSLDYSNLTRTVSTLVKPVMGTMEFVFYAFYVPFRITWDGFDQFISGYQSDPDWTTDVDLVIPQLTLHKSGSTEAIFCVAAHSLGDYLGLPTYVYAPVGVGPKYVENGYSVNCLYFRGYAHIWNEWFRDEATQKSLNTLYSTSFDTSYAYAANNAGELYIYPDSPLSNIYSTMGPAYGGLLCPLNKKRDLFTSALPNAQKGSPVTFGMAGLADVGVVDKDNVFRNFVLDGKTYDQSTYSGNVYLGAVLPPAAGQTLGTRIGGNEINSDPSLSPAEKGVWNSTYFGSDDSQYPFKADLSKATAINVNDLRLAVQTQMIKEIDARYGTRPKEYYQGHFGVLTADSRLQIPEFLGAARVLLNVNQVIQTSQTTSGEGASAQGNQSAYSQTQSKGHLFTKSFTEHGFIMVVGGVRVVGRSYSQGIDKKWSKKTRFDYYLPELAHIGEQPILNKEIYFHDDTQEGSLSNLGVFGYQQAWYEYRYTPNMVTGLLRPTATGTLAYWNFSENFTTTPTLSPTFIAEDRTLIDRCLALPSTNPETGKYTGTDQFLTEFWWENKVTRPMPISSAPGLLDHSGRILL